MGCCWCRDNTEWPGPLWSRLAVGPSGDWSWKVKEQGLSWEKASSCSCGQKAQGESCSEHPGTGTEDATLIQQHPWDRRWRCDTDTAATLGQALKMQHWCSSIPGTGAEDATLVQQPPWKTLQRWKQTYFNWEEVSQKVANACPGGQERLFTQWHERQLQQNFLDGM